MIEFDLKQDAIFKELLEGALDYAIDTIRDLEDDDGDDDFKCLWPIAAKCFNKDNALKALMEIRRYQKRKEIYSVSNYHYMLIYDVLEKDCIWLNDHAKEDKKPIVKVGKCEILKIEFGALSDMYFKDTDFLTDERIMMSLKKDHKKQLGYAPETFGIAIGMAPNREDLKIKLINKKGYKCVIPREGINSKTMTYPG